MNYSYFRETLYSMCFGIEKKTFEWNLTICNIFNLNDLMEYYLQKMIKFANANF